MPWPRQQAAHAKRLTVAPVSAVMGTRIAQAVGTPYRFVLSMLISRSHSAAAFLEFHHVRCVFPPSRVKVLMDTLHTSHWRPSYTQRIKTKKIHSSLRMNCIITMFAAMCSTNRLMPEQISGGMGKAELELNEYVNLCWIGVEIDLFNMIMISTCLALPLLQRFRDS